MIKVNLPAGKDGILKTCTHVSLEIKGDETMVSHRLIEFVDENGLPYQPQSILEQMQYAPKNIILSSAGRYMNAEGEDCNYNDEGAISEMDYYKNIPLSAVPQNITTIFGAVQWLIEQSMLNGNLKGNY